MARYGLTVAVERLQGAHVVMDILLLLSCCLLVSVDTGVETIVVAVAVANAAAIWNVADVASMTVPG